MTRALGLLALCGLLLVACGPSRPSIPVVPEAVSGSSTTALGNRVFFGDSLRDQPDWQADAIAQIDSAEAANPSPTYMGLTFYVFSGPLQLKGATGTPFGSVVSSTISYYDPDSRSVYLSWILAGPLGQPELDEFQVGNVPYELANVRCNCESLLLGGGQ